MPLFVHADRAVLYVHIPKTGGTSVESLFTRNGFKADYLDTGGPGSLNRLRLCPPQHMHAEPLQAILRLAACAYVFATVRHPLARLVSEYRMRMRGRGGERIPLPDWFDDALRRYGRNPYVYENHLRPQADFIVPGCEVFRLEDGLGDKLLCRIEERVGTTLARRRFMTAQYTADIEVPAEEIAAVRPQVEAFYARDYAAFYPPAPA